MDFSEPIDKDDDDLNTTDDDDELFSEDAVVESEDLVVPENIPPVSKRPQENPRHTVEQIMERRRLREELGSVFEDDFDFDDEE